MEFDTLAGEVWREWKEFFLFSQWTWLDLHTIPGAVAALLSAEKTASAKVLNKKHAWWCLRNGKDTIVTEVE